MSKVVRPDAVRILYLHTRHNCVHSFPPPAPGRTFAVHHAEMHRLYGLFAVLPHKGIPDPIFQSSFNLFMFSLNITAPSSYYYRFIDITSLFLIYSLFLLMEC